MRYIVEVNMRTKCVKWIRSHNAPRIYTSKSKAQAAANKCQKESICGLKYRVKEVQ